jgi:protein phosphatase
VDHPELRGMGSTGTIAGFLGETLYVAQVGDSRAYLVRRGGIQQVTKDQSLVQRLVDAGDMTEAEAEVSERRNIILYALGPEPNTRIDLTWQTIRRGDTLVLCTDGLSGQVSNDMIALIVANEPDLAVACQQLIDLANDAGGPDNISVVLARFDGGGLAEPGSRDEVLHRVYPLPDTDGRPAATADRIEEMRAAVLAAIAASPVPPDPSDAPVPATAPIAVPAPAVSPERRSTGRLITALLFLLLIAVGAYVAVQFFAPGQPSAVPSSPGSAL